LFGVATLLLHNARFIQWKPTIFLWLLAIAFLVSRFVGAQPLVQRMLQPALGEATLPRSDWLKLNYAWVVFGLLVGVANLLVAYNVDEPTWVKLKVFGLSGLMILFLVGQLMWLFKRVQAKASTS
jgi:intracellular septation protein